MFAGAAIVATMVMGIGKAGAQTSSEVWTVTLDIYSGRRNPSFTLDAAEVQEIKARLGRAPVTAQAATQKTIRPSKLGYRGILISATAGGKVVEDSEVSKGAILRKGPSARALMNDAQTGIERYLATLAISKGAVSAELGQWLMKNVP
jgi:hypothetical protein